MYSHPLFYLVVAWNDRRHSSSDSRPTAYLVSHVNLLGAIANLTILDHDERMASCFRIYIDCESPYTGRLLFTLRGFFFEVQHLGHVLVQSIYSDRLMSSMLHFRHLWLNHLYPSIQPRFLYVSMLLLVCLCFADTVTDLPAIYLTTPLCTLFCHLSPW